MPPKSTTASAKAVSIPPRKIVTSSDPLSTASSGRPSKSVYDQEQEQLKKEIDQLQAQLADVRLKIGDPKSGGPNAPLVARRKELREEMDTLREGQSKDKGSRTKILDQIRAANDALQRKIKELNANRAKLPYKSSAEVDAKIKQLESQIESGTMRIVEEKKALAEIQNLRKARKLVEAFGPQQDLIEIEKSKIDDLRKQIDDPRSQAINDRWTQIKAELDQINQKLDESSKSRDKFFEERNKLQEDISLLITKKRESTIRHKEANEKFYAKKQEEQERRINRQKAEREAQERAEIEQAHIEMREQAALPAYGREIEDCRTLILFFDKLMGNATTGKAEEAPSSEASKPSSTLPKITDLRQVDGTNGFEGMVAIKKKGAENEEFFMGGGKKNNKKTKKPTTNESSSANQPLNLPLATINALFALAVPVPMTRDEVVKTIATLSEKKNWFTENQERVTKEHIAETESKIAAAQAKFKTQAPAAPAVCAEAESATADHPSESNKPIDANDQAESS